MNLFRNRAWHLVARSGFAFLILIVLPVMVYLCASVMGGLIQRDVPDDLFEAQGEPEAVTVYLITGLLHADSKHQGNPLYFGLIRPAIVARCWQFVGAMAGDLMWARREWAGRPNTRKRSNGSWLPRAKSREQLFRWFRDVTGCQSGGYTLGAVMRGFSRMVQRSTASPL